MNLKTPPSPLSRFALGEDGTAGVELSLIAPVLLMILGLVAVGGECLSISQKVAATTRTITDLVTRNPNLSSADMQTLLNAAASTMAPYDPANLSMVVSEVQVDANGVAKVVWSKSAFNGVALTPGDLITLTSGAYKNDAYYIVGSASYSFTPYGVTLPVVGAITLSDTSIWSPRITSTVNLVN